MLGDIMAVPRAAAVCYIVLAMVGNLLAQQFG